MRINKENCNCKLYSCILKYSSKIQARFVIRVIRDVIFLSYTMLCMFIYFWDDNIFFGDLANFPKMFPSMPKGEIVGNMANHSDKMRYVVVIYGNICFTI